MENITRLILCSVVVEWGVSRSRNTLRPFDAQTLNLGDDPFSGVPVRVKSSHTYEDLRAAHRADDHSSFFKMQ
jgi:hypothetical protein